MFVTWSIKPEGPRPALDPGSPAQASLPINRSLVRGARLIYLTAPPEGSLVVRPARPAWNLDPRTQIPGENRPMFHGPSWGNPLSRPASLTVLVPSEETGAREPRRATEELLFRRLFPAGPE